MESFHLRSAAQAPRLGDRSAPHHGHHDDDLPGERDALHSHHLVASFARAWRPVRLARAGPTAHGVVLRGYLLGPDFVVEVGGVADIVEVEAAEPRLTAHAFQPWRRQAQRAQPGAAG